MNRLIKVLNSTLNDGFEERFERRFAGKSLSIARSFGLPAVESGIPAFNFFEGDDEYNGVPKGLILPVPHAVSGGIDVEDGFPVQIHMFMRDTNGIAILDFDGEYSGVRVYRFKKPAAVMIRLSLTGDTMQHQILVGSTHTDATIMPPDAQERVVNLAAVLVGENLYNTELT